MPFPYMKDVQSKICYLPAFHLFLIEKISLFEEDVSSVFFSSKKLNFTAKRRLLGPSKQKEEGKKERKRKEKQISNKNNNNNKMHCGQTQHSPATALSALSSKPFV